MSQVFAGQQTARLNQWPNSPYVIELGFMSCAFGLLGILSIWVRGTWRQATAVGYGVFLLLAALYHVYDAAANRELLGRQPWAGPLDGCEPRDHPALARRAHRANREEK